MKTLIILLTALALTSCSQCTVDVYSATVKSVYYQPRSWGVSEEWKGVAEFYGKKIEYETSWPVEIGSTIYMPSGCGYFQNWYTDLEQLKN